MKAAAALLSLLALGSCVPTNAEIVAEGQSRMAATENDAKAELAQIKASWDDATAAAIARWNARLVFPLCDEQVPKGSQCGMVSDKFMAQAFRVAFVSEHCSSLPVDASDDYCSGLFLKSFLAAIDDRYDASAEVICKTADCGSFAKTELAVLQGHNARVLALEQNDFDAINVKFGEMSRVVVERLRMQNDKIANDTAAQLEDARAKRAALRAAGASMQAAGSSLSSASQTPAPAPQLPQASVSRGCSSDYECGYGNVCAKDSGSFTGICARAVNAYGSPTFQPPNPNSLGAGSGDCSFDTDCAVGFRCLKSNGGLRGNCMK